MKENPIGCYFARVESNLLRLANSLGEVGTVLTLMSHGSSDPEIDDITKWAQELVARVFGVQTKSGTDTARLRSEEKIAAYSATQREALLELSEFYGEGCRMGEPSPGL